MPRLYQEIQSASRRQLQDVSPEKSQGPRRRQAQEERARGPHPQVGGRARGPRPGGDPQGGEMTKARDIPREGVYPFAMIMGARLREHDDRPGWRGEPFRYLIFRLNEELNKLYVCFSHPVLMDGEAEPMADPERIINEAADVANFAMMIADNLRRCEATEPEEIEYDFPPSCDFCEGKGWIVGHDCKKHTCPKCRGKGGEGEDE